MAGTIVNLTEIITKITGYGLYNYNASTNILTYASKSVIAIVMSNDRKTSLNLLGLGATEPHRTR